MAPLLEIQARLFFVDHPPPCNWLPEKTLLLRRLFAKDEPEVEEIYRLLCRGDIRRIVAFMGGIQQGNLQDWLITTFANDHAGLLDKYRKKQREMENIERAILLSFAALIPPE